MTIKDMVWFNQIIAILLVILVVFGVLTILTNKRNTKRVYCHGDVVAVSATRYNTPIVLCRDGTVEE